VTATDATGIIKHHRLGAPAGLALRIFAGVIDGFLLIIAYLMGALIVSTAYLDLDSLTDSTEEQMSVAYDQMMAEVGTSGMAQSLQIFFLVLLVLNFVLLPMTRARGSLGKALIGLAISDRSGETASIAQASLRGVLGLFHVALSVLVALTLYHFVHLEWLVSLAVGAVILAVGSVMTAMDAARGGLIDRVLRTTVRRRILGDQN